MSSSTEGPRDTLLPPIRRGPSPGIVGTMLLMAGGLGARLPEIEDALRRDNPDAVAWSCICPICGRDAVYFWFPLSWPDSDGKLVCPGLCDSEGDGVGAQVTAALARHLGVTLEEARENARLHLEREAPLRVDVRLGTAETGRLARLALARVPGLQQSGRAFLLEGRRLTRPEFSALLGEILDLRRGERRVAVPAAVVALLNSGEPVDGVPIVENPRDTSGDIERAVQLFGNALVDCTTRLGHAPTAAELFHEERERVTEALGLLGRPATARSLGYALRDRFESVAHTVSGATWRVPLRR